MEREIYNNVMKSPYREWYEKFLNGETSIYYYLKHINGGREPNENVIFDKKNSNIRAPIQLAYVVFNIRFSNSPIYDKVNYAGLEREKIIEPISEKEFEFLNQSKFLGSNFISLGYWEARCKREGKLVGTVEKWLEKVKPIIHITDSKPKVEEKKEEKIDMDYVKKILDEGDILTAIDAYAKIKGMKANQIDYRKFRRLMKGEDINILKDQYLPKPPKPLPLYKSINLEPFKKIYNEGKIGRAYSEYAKAINLHPIKISIKLFRRLMEGEDIDPILKSHDPIESKIVSSEPEIRNNIIGSRKHLKLSSKDYARGAIEGIESDGRVCSQEIDLYARALKTLNNDVSGIPKNHMIRAGKKAIKILETNPPNRFSYW